MKKSDFHNLIPTKVFQACLDHCTLDEEGAVASIEYRMTGEVVLHIHTALSHWERDVNLDAYLQDPDGAWMPGLAWLG
jgi:hypothetical protein